MSILKHTAWPARWSGARLSDFFGEHQFIDRAWLQQQTVKSVHINETLRQYHIHLSIQRMIRKSLRLYLQGKQLVVQGEAESSDGNKVSFRQQFYLPHAAGDQKPRYTYRSGKLKIILPKLPTPAREFVHMYPS